MKSATAKNTKITGQRIESTSARLLGYALWKGNLASDEAHWDLKFSDIIRIVVLHPVYAFKPLL